MGFFRISVTLLAVALTACGNAPVQEMSNARQAIDSAHTIEAQKHAPNLMLMARGRLVDAKLALHRGDWKKARISAIEARGHAIKARARVVSNADEN